MTTEPKTFDLIVEGDPSLSHDGLIWNGDSPPDIVSVNGKLLVKVARYLAPGDRYCYRVATTAQLGDMT